MLEEQECNSPLLSDCCLFKFREKMREQLSEMERQRKTLDIVSQELQQVLVFILGIRDPQNLL